MAPSAPASPVRRLFEDRISQLVTEVDGLLVQGRDRARLEFAEQINQSVRRMRQTSDSEDLAATLVDAASGFAAGVAFLRIEGDSARGERIRGVSEQTADRFPGIRISLASAAALRGVVETRDPVTALAIAGEVSPELMEMTGDPADERVTIFPVMVRENVRGLLYSWGGAQTPAIELLCQVAAAVWTGMEPVTVTAPAPDLVQIAPPERRSRPTWDSLPADEQQLHLRGQRFARVQVSEMRLHQGQAVQAGRTRRDLYGALRDAIDAARARFREEYFTKCPSMVDYLHLELVRTLANDDVGALGKDYPGPLV
jgi:hypothetical protein